MTSEILADIPEQLLINTPNEGIIAPSFRELDNLAAIDGVEKRVIAVYDDTRKIVGCAVCFIEQRRHHGFNLKVYSLFGYHVHDYSRIYCKNSEALSCLKQSAIRDASKNHCDIIIWENIPIECLEDTGEQPSCREMKIFSSVAGKDGWSELYNRRSVKRFTNKAKRLGQYSVEIIDGEVSDAMMEDLKQFHIRRWNFAQSGSAFHSNKYRIKEYKALTENKHYLRILINGEILACHYGMKYGKTLLWHTPVINPKYLELSPLKLLISETAKYCESHNLEMLDFGLGDEEYKDTYVNQDRETYTFHKPLTIKGLLAYRAGKINKKRIQNGISVVKKGLRRIQKVAFKPQLYYYECNPETRISNDVDGLFRVIESWPEFFDFLVSRNVQPLKWHHDRFQNDASTKFITIADDKEIYSYGWVSLADPFYVGETDEYISLGNKVCLYDFVTPPQFRGKGYYTKLLKSANAFFDNTVIYAKKSNAASRKAIERSGFVRFQQ